MDNRKTNIHYELKNKPILCDTFGYIETAICQEEMLSPLLIDRIAQDSIPIIVSINDVSGATMAPGILYAVIHAKKSGKVFWVTDSIRGEKIYINHQFRGYATDVVSEVFLQQGDNLLVIELLSHTPQPFSIRFSPETFEKESPISMFYTNNTSKGMMIHVLDRGYSPYERQKYEFYLVPATTEMISPAQHVRVEVMEMATRTVLESFHIPFETWGAVDLSKYEYDHDEVTCLAVRFLYQTSLDIEWMIARNFSFYPMREKIEIYIESLRELRHAQNLSALATDFIDYSLQELKNIDLSSIGAILQILSLKKSLDDLLNKTPEAYYYSPGTVYLYIRSKLDDLILRVPVCVPLQYNPTVAYPLVINHEIAFFSANCRSINAPDCLMMNMTGRGITFGGYVGEACFFEILGEVQRIYKIDTSKIFGLGHCSAATAVLNFAHNYPDLYAGVLLSECMHTPSNMKNFEGLKIIALYSEHSLLNERTVTAKNALAQMPNSEIHILKACVHNMVQRCYYQRNLIQQLVETIPTRRKNKIYFETYSNRYKKSSWIDIVSMKDPEKCAEVDAEINGDNSIKVSAINVTGFSVCSPFASPKDFTITVNHSFLTCSANEADRYQFIEKDGKWFQTDRVNNAPMHLGLGLLDVYLSPVLVWNLCAPNEYAANTASAFSVPKVLANIPHIFVEYPIVSCVNEEIFVSHSLIIIDDLSAKPNPFLERIKEQLNLKCNLYGYHLDAKQYEGDYCSMEVTSNPWNPNHSILFICTNRPSLLSKNLFTRLVRLPSLASGRHPYLNSRILIYQNHNYKVIQ